MPPKDKMNLYDTGPQRPTLSLAYGEARRAEAGLLPSSGVLSGRELRRIVSEMIG